MRWPGPTLTRPSSVKPLLATQFRGAASPDKGGVTAHRGGRGSESWHPPPEPVEIKGKNRGGAPGGPTVGCPRAQSLTPQPCLSAAAVPPSSPRPRPQEDPQAGAPPAPRSAHGHPRAQKDGTQLCGHTCTGLLAAGHHLHRRCGAAHRGLAAPALEAVRAVWQGQGWGQLQCHPDRRREQRLRCPRGHGGDGVHHP